MSKSAELIWTEYSQSSAAVKGGISDSNDDVKFGFLIGWKSAITRYEQHLAATPNPSSGAPPSESLIEHLTVLISDWEHAKYREEAARFASGVCASDLQRVLDEYRGEIVVAEGRLLKELIESWREYGNVCLNDDIAETSLGCARELELLVETFPKRSDCAAAGSNATTVEPSIQPEKSLTVDEWLDEDPDFKGIYIHNYDGFVGCERDQVFTKADFNQRLMRCTIGPRGSGESGGKD